MPGGDGALTTVVDVEYSWVLDHEDLGLDASANIDTQATLSDPFDDTNHGTAVLGVLRGGANAYGVSGIVPAATESTEQRAHKEDGKRRCEST